MKTNINNLLFDSTIDKQMDDTKPIEEKDNDNTLMKYFFEEKNNKSIEEAQINFEKIEKFFKKPIKLRNALEKCYWDRQKMVFFFLFIRIWRILKLHENDFYELVLSRVFTDR